MAFNIQAFKTRALTAIVFVAIMLVGLLWNHWSFFILFSIIHFGCWIEYQALVQKFDPGYKSISDFHKYGIMFAGWALMLWLTDSSFAIGTFTLHALGFWIILLFAFVLPIVEILLSNTPSLKNIRHSLFGLLYISLSWALMIDIRQMELVNDDGLLHEFGRIIAIVLIASIWINDTMAYIVGSLIGKRSLSSISPKKTWEGTIGGAILCIATVTLVGFYFLPVPPFILMIVSAIAAIAGTLGDLLESKLKRMAGVKDSGQLMPGHGGFLDRFDSLIIATPVVWLYLAFFV